MASSRMHPPRMGGHDDDAAGQEDALEHAVGDESDGEALVLPKPQQVFVEPETGDLVERGKRLVHQAGCAAGSPAPGRSKPASSCRRRARAAWNAATPDRWTRSSIASTSRRRLASRPAAQPERQPDIVEHARPRHQRRLLEDEPDIHAARRLPAPLDPPRRRRRQPGDQAQRRRLAAARRPEQRHEIAVRQAEIDARDGDDPVGKGLADVAQREQRARRRRPGLQCVPRR